MPRSYGYWLDPRTGVFYTVTTHQDWVLENAALIGVEEIVRRMNRVTDEDEIRIVGCKAGLVRVRDYGVRASVQFWAASKENVTVILNALSRFVVEKEFGDFKWLWLHNLSINKDSSMNVKSFLSRVVTEADIFIDLDRP